MIRRARFIPVVVGLTALLTADTATAAGVEPLPGTNLALGKPAAFSWEPNYRYCKGGDETDLTDGKLWQSGGFWTDKGTVGWQFGRKPGVLITFDLGQAAPIDAVSFDTVAGSSQVTFPAAVFLYVSDDGERWRYVTNVLNEAIPQNSFVRHRFVAAGLKTRARHVALYVVQGGFYAFVDEIEIVKGEHDPATAAFPGPPVERARLESDAVSRNNHVNQATQYFIRAARQQVEAMPGLETAAVLAALERLQAGAARAGAPAGDIDFSRGLPYSDLDRQVCAAMGTFFQGLGHEAVVVWEPPVTMWDHTTNPFARPQQVKPPVLHADMMIGEFEPVAFNVSNNTMLPQTVRIDVSDLQARVGGTVWPNEKIERRVATHVVCSGFLFLDDALPLIKDNQVTIAAGMTRQIWLLPHSGARRPGDYTGVVTVAAGDARLEMPLSATVYPLEMPANPSYKSTGWGYFTWKPAVGYEPEAAREMARSYENAHVLHHHYIPWPKVDPATKKMLHPVQVDFTKMDEMVSYRPYVSQWLLWPGFEFGYMSLNYRGATDMPAVGSDAHDAMFKEWVRQIRDHMREKGFSTEQWAFYWVDEPGEKRFVDYIVPASRMAKEVDPTILVWEDHQIPLELLEKHPDAIDIHCCPLGYYREHPDTLAHALAEKQPSVHYLCGSSKANDPHSYYRLHHMAAVELGLNGAGMWVWGDDGGQFNDYAGPSQSYGMVYASADGPITGKRREAWREGIEDVELWRHLRQAAERTGDQDLLRLVRESPTRVLGGPEHLGSPGVLMQTRLEVLKAVSAAAAK